MDWSLIWNTAYTWLTSTGIKVVVALVVLFISFRVINWLGRRIERRYDKSKRKEKIDKTIYRTLSYTLRIALKILVGVGLVGYLGIDTSGVAALIASLGVGVGLAVNGALSNIAGGVLLLITRPLRVDDFIEAGGFSGTVEDIRLCHTKIRTPDNKVVFIPNGTLSGATVVNYSMKDARRVDLTFSISYQQDFQKAMAVIEGVYAAHGKVLDDPAPTVRMTAHGESSIELTAKVWVKKEDYWNVRFDLLEQIKRAFDENGIEIPFNQLDVHIKN